MSDNMCEHGGLDGNCLRCKDATIAALRAEVERLKVKLERWKIPHTIEELTEMKEQSNQPSLAAKQAYINALEWHFSESRARAEQAEKELVGERGKVEEFLSCEHTISNGGLMDNYTDVARARRRQAEIINEWKRSAK